MRKKLEFGLFVTLILISLFLVLPAAVEFKVYAFLAWSAVLGLFLGMKFFGVILRAWEDRG